MALSQTKLRVVWWFELSLVVLRATAIHTYYKCWQGCLRLSNNALKCNDFNVNFPVFGPCTRHDLGYVPQRSSEKHLTTVPLRNCWLRVCVQSTVTYLRFCIFSLSRRLCNILCLQYNRVTSTKFPKKISRLILSNQSMNIRWTQS